MRKNDLEKSKVGFHNLQKMMNLVSDAVPILVSDKESDTVFINQKFEQLFGYPRKISQTHEAWWPLTAVDEAHEETIKNQWGAYLKRCDVHKGMLDPMEVTIICRAGEKRHIECRVASLGDRAIVVCNDMTEFRRAEDELAKTNETLKTWIYELELQKQRMNWLHLMGDALQACNNFDDAYAIIRQYSRQIFPKTRGALYELDETGYNLKTSVTWGRYSQNNYTFGVNTCQALQKRQFFHGFPSEANCTCRHAGASRTGQILCIPMMNEGKPHGLLNVAFYEKEMYEKGAHEFALVVTEHLALALANLKLKNMLRTQAMRDPLTGLFNRRYMEESFEREFHRSHRNNRPVSIIMLDIDHFKKFNDRYGHDVGDILLKALGAMLRGIVRKEDIACRYGGEEFILILPEATIEIATQRAEYFRKSLQLTSFKHHDQNIGTITVSMGVAAYPDHGQDAETVLRKADEALYKAKKSGRNRVETALPFDI
jgi:diguanylate cyclase (GGDEF)-like protein